MGHRFTVMGFTEAELGFALAAFFVAVGAGYLSERDRVMRNQRPIAVQRDSLTRAAAEAARRFDSLQLEHRRLRDSVEKRSSQTPLCRERGEPDTPVAVISVLGANAYEIGGEALAFAGILDRLSVPRARSAQLECRYSVEVVVVAGVDAPQFATATDRLRRVFNLRYRVPAP